MKNWLRATTAFAGAAALTLGGAIAGVAQASGEDVPVSSFEVTWSDKVNRYDDALKGKQLNMMLYCEIKEVKEGKLTGPGIGYEWIGLNLTVGKDENKPIEIRANNPARQKADEVGIDYCYEYRTGGYGDPQFSFSSGRNAGVQQLAMNQQVNTNFKFELVEGEWDGETYVGVLPEDNKPQVDIGVAGRSTKDPLNADGEKVFNLLYTKGGDRVANSYSFADGAAHTPSAELDEDRVDTPITRAAIGNSLDMFSGYTGRYKEYQLQAFFGEPGKTLSEDGLFRIEGVEGNESDGWVVKLSSAIRKVTPEAPAVVDAEQCGVEGTVQLPNSKYFDYEVISEGTTVSVAALLKQDFKNRFIVEGDTDWELSVAAKPCTLDPAEEATTPKAPETTAQPKKKLASTGVEITSLASLSAVLILAGGALALRRFA